MKTLSELKAQSKVETLLRQRERSEEERLVSELKKEREKVETRKRERSASVKTPGFFIAAQLDKTKSEKALLVRLKKQRSDIPSDGRLLFVAKIHHSLNTAGSIKKALATLRLIDRGTGVFVRANQETHQLLKISEPYIAFGEPTEANIERLIRKRGRVLHKGQEIALRDNNLIEEKLEAQGIICIEDLIYEIGNLTELFEVATAFLSPFRLNLPTDKKFKRTSYTRGGDYGYREHKINELIESMT